MDRNTMLAAAAAVLLTALALVGPALLPGSVFLPLLPEDFPAWGAGEAPAAVAHHPAPNRNMSDVLHLLLPGLATTEAAFSRGELPLWDPSQALGLPHIDQVHYGVFYPPAWLPLLFGVYGLGLMALVHVLVAGWGMLLYLRTIDRSTAACVVGAVCFACSAWVMARLHAFPVVGAAVWTPWILWGLERGARNRSWRPRMVAAAAVALSVFANFPQVTMWVLLLAGLLEVVRVPAWMRARQGGPESLLAAGLTVALGLALAAPQVLPTAEYLRGESARSDQTVEALLADGLEWPLLWHLISPNHYSAAPLDRPDRPHPVALMDLEQAERPVAINRAETSMGIGALGLVLALVALVFGRNWRTLTFSAVTVGVFALLLWPGALALAYDVLPPIRFGNPKRLLLLSTFALSVLAAGGVDLVRTPRLPVTVVAWILSVVGLAVAVMLRLSVPSAALAEDVDTWAGQLLRQAGRNPLALDEIFAVIPREAFAAAAAMSAASSLLAVAALALAVLTFRPKRKLTSEGGWATWARRKPTLLGVFIAAELVLGSWSLVRPAPAAEVASPITDLGAVEVPALVVEVRALAHGDPVPLRIGRFGNEPPWLRPDFPSLFGLHDLQCYAPMAPRRVTELLDALEPGVVVNGSTLAGFSDPTTLSRPLLDGLGVDVLLTDRPGELPGWSDRSQVGLVRVLENDEALPRAHLVHEIRVLPGAEARLSYLVSDEFNPRAEVVLSAAPPTTDVEWRRRRAAEAVRRNAGVPVVTEEAVMPEPAAGPRTARVVDYAPGHLRVVVPAGEPGFLVVSETWNRNWRARVGAEEAPVVEADHAILAVPVESPHEVVVTLDYEPGSVTWGLRIAAGATLLLVLGLFVGRGRPRGTVPPPPGAHPDLLTGEPVTRVTRRSEVPGLSADTGGAQAAPPSGETGDGEGGGEGGGKGGGEGGGAPRG